MGRPTEEEWLRRREGAFIDELRKSRDGVSRWYRRGAVRREEDLEFAAAAKALDQAASEEP